MGPRFSCIKATSSRATPLTDCSDSDDDDDQFSSDGKGYKSSAVESATVVRENKLAPRSAVLLPLYIYPSPEAWTPLQEAIAAYPTVFFTVIINPFNGPGLDDLPDECYQKAILTLTCHANVRVLGYVHTSWAKRDIGLVCKDIDKYGQWAERSGNPELKVTGIFVDETPNVYSTESECYLAKLGKRVKEMPGGDDNIIIHNPGCVPDRAFLALPDSTVIFEDTYHNFRTRVSNAVFSAVALSKVDRSKLGCVIHSVPEDLSSDEWLELGRQVREIAGDVFITCLSHLYYESFAPGWAKFVDAMAA